MLRNYLYKYLIDSYTKRKTELEVELENLENSNSSSKIETKIYGVDSNDVDAYAFGNGEEAKEYNQDKLKHDIENLDKILGLVQQKKQSLNNLSGSFDEKIEKMFIDYDQITAYDQYNFAYLNNQFDSNPEKIWETNLLGKSLSELVGDNVSSKIVMMPADAQRKMRKTLCRIINEGKGGVLCILL